MKKAKFNYGDIVGIRKNGIFIRGYIYEIFFEVGTGTNVYGVDFSIENPKILEESELDFNTLGLRLNKNQLFEALESPTGGYIYEKDLFTLLTVAEIKIPKI